jgi:polyhydroxyalkanoate synthase
MEKTQVAATGHQVPAPNFEEMSRNMAQFVEEAGKAAAAYIRPLEEGHSKPA